MKTRRQNYSPGDVAKDKKLKTNADSIKKLSNSPLTKVIGKRPKRNTQIIEKENVNSSSKGKTKKPQTNLKVTENKNLKSKPKGKQSKTNEVTKAKRETPLSKAKKPKDYLVITEENCIIPRKGKGRPPKTLASQKTTTKTNPQNIEENCITLRKGRGRQPRTLASQKMTTKTNNPQNIDENCVTIRKGRGRQSKTFTRQKMITKADNPQNMELIEENCGTLRKGKGRQTKTTITNLQNVKDVEVVIVEMESRSPLNKLKCKTTNPDDMERSPGENVKVSDDEDNIEIIEDDDVEFLEKVHIKTQDGNDVESMKENDMDMQEKNTLEASENKDQEIVVSDDNNDDCPDEVTFGSSKEEAMEKMKLIKNEIDKIKNERKEMRKKIHDRNILQKKEKKDKVAEIQKRKLPPQLLEYVSKLPKTAKHFESKQTKLQELEPMDTDEDENCEESAAAPKEFISIYGSTEFKPQHLQTVIKKPHSVTDSIAKFKERAFFGSKNKRESVWDLKSNLIKQAVAGKL